jgi:serine/threonine protein kinase
MDVPAIPDSVVRLFAKLLTTSVYQKLEERSENNMVFCFFRDKRIKVHITESKIEGGLHVFFSESLRIMLINDGKSLRYVAKLRPDLRLRHEKKSGKVYFVPSDDTSHPPIILGGGSYGFAFKILGVDGSWCVVKVFGKKEDAEHEWSALTLIKGKHQSFQEGIALQTEREGDVQHIIVSCFQGDIVLSKVRDSIYLLNLQQIIWMFLEFAKGIKKLHENGILHCDIKPDNLIISQDPQGRLVLTLIDFGIASRIGSTTDDPQSYYTLWYRSPRLVLDDFLRSFNKNLTLLEPVMDWWAFFITFLHAVSEKSTDFLGFRLKTEEEAYQHMIRTSCVAQLMKKMKRWLGEDNRSVDFVRQIYFVLRNKEGPEKFVESFNTVGIKLTGTGVYDEYLNMFDKLRDNHPMIAHVRNVFKHVKCKDEKIDISGPMKNLTNLFVEILRDGADLSLLDCLTMDHIQQWLDRLNESLLELCKLKSRILFY